MAPQSSEPTLAAIISEISYAQNTPFWVVAGPFPGGSNSVYEIQSERGDRWCLRIPLNADTAYFVTKGTAILKDLKARLPAIPAPAIIRHSENYTVLEYLDGAALKSWNTISLTTERRQLILNDLAAFLFSLWTPDDRVAQDIVRRITYREWLQNEVDRGLRRTLQGTSAWGDPVHYLNRRLKIDELVPDPDDGTLVIKHGDLNAWNVIVSEKGLSGVVDWDTSRLAPAPAAIQHPLFIADIPGWRNDDVPQGMTFEEDRAYLETVIGKLDESSPFPGRMEKLLRTSFERQFLALSLHNRRINNEYIQQRCMETETNPHAFLAQLEDFLSMNESMRTLPAVADVRNRLSSITVAC